MAIVFYNQGEEHLRAGSLDIIERPLKQYILLSGLDYPSRHNGYKLTGDSSIYVKKRMDEIIAESKDEEKTKITTISLLNGTIDISTYEKKKCIDTETKKYDKITQIDNYTTSTYYFQFNGKNIITKKDIYQLIENIGDSNPNTLIEFGVYSHAYFEGPILVDSDSFDNTNDNDFRISDIKLLKESFASAFCTDGKIIIWGCSFPLVLNSLFAKLRSNRKYTLSSINDSEVFSYPANHFHADLTFTTDVDALIKLINNCLKSSFDKKNKIDLTFLQIKKILCVFYLNTYAATMAKTLGVTVKSALPATYSDITPTYQIAASTMANVNFYKVHLDITLDDNYGIYDKATIQRIFNIYNS